METIVETTLKDILTLLAVPHAGIDRSEIAGQVIFSITTEPGAPSMLDTSPEMLHALDYLVKKIAETRSSQDAAPPQDTREDTQEDTRAVIVIDVNGVRTRHIKDLHDKAIMMAERARSFKYDVELTPMSAYDRLIIHTTLQGAPSVTTESQGEGHDRRVVIKYAA